MRILTLLLLLTGLFSGSIVAQSECNLPAPAQISIIEQTPTTVDVTWTAVSGAWGYESVLDDGITKVTAVHPGMLNTTTKFNVLPGVDYTVYIYPKCTEGTTSPNGIMLKIDGVHIIVIDIMTSAQGTFPNSANDVLLFQQNSLPNGTTVNTQVVFQKEQSYYFTCNFGEETNLLAGSLEINPAFQTDDHVKFMEILTPQTLNWEVAGTGISYTPPVGAIQSSQFAVLSPVSGSPVSLTLSFLPGTTVAQPFQIKASGNNPGGTSLIKNFKLYRVSGISNTPPKDNSYEAPDTGVISAAAGPNPFNDHLNILLSNTPSIPVSVAIFDINGRLEQTRVLTAATSVQRVFTLETEGLSTGIHIVRIDTGTGNIQTFKMVKM